MRPRHSNISSKRLNGRPIHFICSKAMKVTELKDLLTKAGLQTTGKKEELISRLLSKDAGGAADEEDPLVSLLFGCGRHADAAGRREARAPFDSTPCASRVRRRTFRVCKMQRYPKTADKRPIRPWLGLGVLSQQSKGCLQRFLAWERRVANVFEILTRSHLPAYHSHILLALPPGP